jgi:hypothetical protein
VPRVWLTCALATAVVVAAILVVTSKPAAKADDPAPPKPPSRLSEQEIRTYIEMQPEITRVLGEIVMEFQRERVMNEGNADEAAFKVKSQSAVDALLERRHLTRETWDVLRRRVEYAVDVVRSGTELEEARPEIEEKIGMKKALLPKLAREDERAMVEKEIKDLEALLEGRGPPLLDEDRDLLRQYWRSLDAAVPPRGPPTKSKKPK